MVEKDPKSDLSRLDALALAEIGMEAAVARSLDGFARNVLPQAADILRADAAFLYAADPRLPKARFFQSGLPSRVRSAVKACCSERLASGDVPGGTIPLTPSTGGGGRDKTQARALRADGACVGFFGVLGARSPAAVRDTIWDHAADILGPTVDRLVTKYENEKQLAQLNTYMMVSSMLSQSMDLHELLNIVLNSCIEAVGAEAASVLLLDDEQTSFRFYQVAGPASPLLAGSTFPADKGIAGSVARLRTPEIVNDVASDSRFYGKLDTESGFATRNLIAIPLDAAGELVGVLEVLNKSEGSNFDDDDCVLLVTLAEEIAFAIRNAKIFEYVADTYCKQRQGRLSCKGCKRPLGSWTPCVKYREAAL
jgi:hypothetical protein